MLNSRFSLLFVAAGLALTAVSQADTPRVITTEGISATTRSNAINLSVSGDPDLVGWAKKALDAHGAFDVKPSGSVNLKFAKSGPTSVTITASGSQSFEVTGTGADSTKALWSALDKAIVLVGKKFGVKPIFAGTKLAFVRETGADRKEIYVGDLMLPGAKPVTGHGSLTYSPHWSPDGRSIYYTSHHRNGAPDVFRTSLDGGVTKIADYRGTNTGGALSPDGSRLALALSTKGTLDIYLASPNGTGAKPLVATDDVETSPCWSPDGSRLAFTGGVSGRPQIMIVPVSGGSPRKVSTGGYSSEPAWNPVLTNQIAYTQGNCAGIGVADLGGNSFTVPSDPKGKRVNQPVSRPTWCADGRHLVVTIGSGKVTKLGLLDTQSGKLTALSGAQFGNCSDPAAHITK